MNSKASGFTIIELIVVIALLGILSAVALPRFISLTDNAHTASVSGAGAGFATGVALIRAQSIAEGVVDERVEGFGDGTLFVNTSGAPMSVTSASARNCKDIWEKLLQTNAPTLGASGADTDYTTDITNQNSNGICIYRYKTDHPDNGERTITYDTINRSVRVRAAGAST